MYKRTNQRKIDESLWNVWCTSVISWRVFSRRFLLTFFFSYYLNTLQNVYTISYAFPFYSISLKCLSSICLHWNGREQRERRNIHLKFGNVLIILMLPLTVMMVVSMCMTTVYYTALVVVVCFCVYAPFFPNEIPHAKNTSHFFAVAFKFIGVSFCMNEWTIFRW